MRHPRESGFTAVEIIIVAGILLAIGTVATLAIQNRASKTDIAADAPLGVEEKAPHQFESQTQPKTNQEQVSSDDVAILEAAKVFCQREGISPCDGTITARKGQLVTVGTPKATILLSKKSGAWQAVLASEEKDICKTGSGSPELREFCQG